MGEHATETHISEARKAIKTALLDAQSSNMHKMRQAQAKQMKKEAKKQKKEAKKHVNAEGEKTFTWAELEAGKDAEAETSANKKLGHLVDNLASAPKAKNAKDDAEKEQEDNKMDALRGTLNAVKDQVGFKEVKEDDKDADDVVEEDEETEDSDEDDRKEEPKESAKKDDRREDDRREDDRDDDRREDDRDDDRREDDREEDDRREDRREDDRKDDRR